MTNLTLSWQNRRRSLNDSYTNEIIAKEIN